MRGFAAIQYLATTAFIFVAAAFWGICMIPSAGILLWTSEFVADFSFVEQAIGFGLAGGAAFLAFGLCTIFLSGFIGMLTKPRLPEARVPLQSYTTIRWALASVLHRFALLFLRHLTPTWIGNTHYRMMGAKIGKGVQINSDNLNDAWTLTDRRWNGRWRPCCTQRSPDREGRVGTRADRHRQELSNRRSINGTTRMCDR